MYSIQYIQLFSVHFVFIYFKSNFIECISSGIIILSILVRVRTEYRLSRQPNTHTQKRRNNALNIKNYRFHFLIAADVEKSSYFSLFLIISGSVLIQFLRIKNDRSEQYLYLLFVRPTFITHISQSYYLT